MTYRIRDWDSLFENNRTRTMKRMDWVPIPNRMDGNGYLSLLRHRHGAAHFGAWIAIVEIASRCPRRGVLTTARGDLHTASTLARVSSIPVEVMSTALRRLVEVGWLEVYDETAVVSKEVKPEIRQEGAGDRLRNGIEEKGTERNTAQAQAPAGLALLDDYGRFIDACHAAQLSGSEVDLEAAHLEWNRLDFGQKMAACQGITARVAAGEYDDPGFRPLPQNYLKKRMWQRQVRPRTNGQPSKMDHAVEILRKNLALEGKL